MAYYKRLLEDTVKQYLAIFPAIAITGPRQSGKSTLLRENFLDNYKYVTFDDPIQVDFFRTDPKGFMKTHSGNVIFDEVQRVQELFHFLKIIIDNNRGKYGQFILTGSNQFQMHEKITETLAGRIGLLSLLPFQLLETPSKLQSDSLLYGGYPELIVRKYKNSKEWFAAYVQNYIERDVRSVANIGNIRDFQRLLFLLAARVSQELNMSNMASEIGVTVKTIQRWISILENSYLIFLLPPFHKNYGKRIVKRPKIYFYDTGLVCYLTGIRTLEILKQGPLAGPIFENLIVADIKKDIFHQNKDMRLYYFRSNLGIEIDLIIENIEQRIFHFIEIKNSYTFRPKMIKPLKKLMDFETKSIFETQKFKIQGTLLYQGKEQLNLSENIFCKNYLTFLINFSRGQYP
ncbi:MAG: ATP-binding protein [Candidatus Anammoxibacter sp.]